MNFMIFHHLSRSSPHFARHVDNAGQSMLHLRLPSHLICLTTYHLNLSLTTTILSHDQYLSHNLPPSHPLSSPFSLKLVVFLIMVRLLCCYLNMEPTQPKKTGKREKVREINLSPYIIIIYHISSHNLHNFCLTTYHLIIYHLTM